jgi:hypothetical protein
VFGRADISEFTTQAKNKLREVRASASNDRASIEKLYGRPQASGGGLNEMVAGNKPPAQDAVVLAEVAKAEEWLTANPNDPAAAGVKQHIKKLKDGMLTR